MRACYLRYSPCLPHATLPHYRYLLFSLSLSPLSLSLSASAARNAASRAYARAAAPATPVDPGGGAAQRGVGVGVAVNIAVAVADVDLARDDLLRRTVQGRRRLLRAMQRWIVQRQRLGDVVLGLCGRHLQPRRLANMVLLLIDMIMRQVQKASQSREAPRTAHKHLATPLLHLRAVLFWRVLSTRVPTLTRQLRILL